MAEISTEIYDAFAVAVKRKLTQFITDRQTLEQQWLVNLRQYRGVYDQEVLDRIPKDKSKAYPRDTRTKVRGHVAKMMEMMFPAQDRNWDLENSPYPSLPTEVLNEVLDTLAEEAAAEAAQQQQQAGAPQGVAQLPMAQNQQVPPLTDEAIEEAINKEADQRRMRMRKRIEDQLFDPDVDWPTICRRVVRSGAIYGIGVVQSPIVRDQAERTWALNQKTGKYEAQTVKEPRPYPAFSKIWDIYPDLSAESWGQQEGLFERLVFSRSTLKDLGKRDGFKTERINNYLRDHQTGNYTVRSFETSLSAMNSTTMDEQNKSERRYEVFRWIGFCSGSDLQKAGVPIKESEVYESILSDVWLLDDVIIFADKAAFGEKPADVYHAYIYAEDEEAGLTGIGMPQELRDRQMSICSGTRALYDNMAATAGPMYEVAIDLLKRPSQAATLNAFTVIEREGDGPDLQYPAVRPVQTDSHVAEISNILQGEREQFDAESNLPSWMFGNTEPLGEAFRTSSNMSQMQGGGNMVTKDQVRNFDIFVSSTIRSILNWNMEFSPHEGDKGDYQIKARGADSLVAKEVRGAALDQFVSTLDPRDKALLKRLPTLVERLKSRDLPTDLAVSPEEAEKIMARMDQAEAAAAQVEQGLTSAKTEKFAADAQAATVAAERSKEMFEVDVTHAIAQIEKLLAEAKASRDQQQLALIDRMVSGLAAEADGGTDGTATGEGASAANN